MSGYVARKYDNRDNIKMILNDLKMPTLEEPEALDSIADGVDKDIYRKEVKSYARENYLLTRIAKTLYSLVLGQCTDSMRAKMKGK